MNSNQLRLELEKKYEVLCLIDLSEVNQNHSSIYKILHSCHKDIFGPKERIVFYSKFVPSDQLLQHIQNAVNLIDISACFIMICGPHDLADKLKKTSHDNNTIEYFPIMVESNVLLPDKLHQEKTLCPLPWMHLEIKHNGDIYPCCVSTSLLGSASENNLDSIMQGSKMNQLRSEFLAGRKPKGCDHCWKLESNQQQSPRQWYAKYYQQKFYTQYLDDIKIRSLDIKPGNVCNFKCRICDATNSSLYADEYYNHTKISVQPPNARWVEYNSYVWQQLEKLLPNIENLYLYGGEPFLVKEIPKLLKSAIDQQRHLHIRLHFNSNGSVFPTNLLPTLKKFKHVDIALSIDNIGTRFELERGGRWKEVEQNVLNFNKLNDQQLTSYIMPTVNIQNVYYLDEIFDWADYNKIKVNLSFLSQPQWASIDYLTPEAAKLVADKFVNSPRSELRALAHRVTLSPKSDGREFVDQIKRFDLLRNQNFCQSHKEIAQAMGY